MKKATKKPSLEELRKATKQPSPEELLEELRGKLAESRAIYDGDITLPGVDGDRAVMRRLAAYEAVTAVVNFLSPSGVPEADIQPLLDIMDALFDHLCGKPNSLFAVTKKAGRSTHRQVDYFRVAAAAVITLLIEAGEKKTATIKRVADVLTKAGIPNATEKQVASWYRQTTSGHGDINVYYKFAMYHLHRRSLDRPYIEYMLRELPGSAPPEGL